MKGKFYYRCARVHQILAAVIEQALFSKFLELLEDAERSLAHEVMTYCDSNVEHYQHVAGNAAFNTLMKRYGRFFHMSSMENTEKQQHTRPHMCMT